ncbi:MAG: VOC family protein, partial [Actinomycetota bacterium]
FVHFGFRMTDANEVRALKGRLDRDGFEIMDEEDASDVASFKCRDPDGYLVEVYWSPGATDSGGP